MLLLETPFSSIPSPIPAASPTIRRRPGEGGQYSHGATWIVDGFMRLAEDARIGAIEDGRPAQGPRIRDFREDFALKKTDPDKIAIYGLIPIQQPADIYDG